jgi:shikimate kinase
MDNKVVYLTGFMGSGKSTIGPILANTLGWEFLDLDLVIENETGMKIKEIFDVYGEEHFRNLERKALLKISDNHKIIVSLGGGTITNEKNLEILKKTGLLFYLKLSPVSAYRRLKYKRDRPVLLSDLGEIYSKEDLLKKINMLFEKRKIFYEQADFIIETDNMPVGKTVDRIVKIINNEIEPK